MAEKNPGIRQLVKDFSRLRVLIIGDVMVDSYMWGRVERISPEAPVPIVAVSKKEIRPGGAANVALNIQSLGATPLLCSVIGNDEAGKQFSKMILGLKMDTSFLVPDNKRRTTVKTRVIGNNHQMLRVDEEEENHISEKSSAALLSKIISVLKTKKADVVIFEDYDKGVITPRIIEETVAAANRSSIPVVVDPKKKNFLNYRNVTVMKPNLKELREGMKIDIDKENLSDIKKAASQLKHSQDIDTVMVTLSEKGIFISNSKVQQIVPARVHNVADVSGAGDTVISITALCTALGLSSVATAQLANLAGGQVIEKIGVVPVNLKQLVETVEKEKIF
jgi:D-glycero-beta-D-manno-heptose-7-phosphate kinase